MEIPRNDAARFVAPGHRRKLLAAEYRVLSWVANVFGAVFWLAEQNAPGWQINSNN
jgi:hypothetical protein